MQFVWARDPQPANTELVFSVSLDTPCDTLLLCAVDTYTVYGDGRLLAYGPERTAAGYSRRKHIPVAGCRLIEVHVLHYGVSVFSVDRQDGFFGASLSFEGREVYTTADFACRKDGARLVNMPRYSRQRGFAEGYDLTRRDRTPVPLAPVPAPCLLDGNGEVCDYRVLTPAPVDAGHFSGFDEIRPLVFYHSQDAALPEGALDVEGYIARAAAEGWCRYDYALPHVEAGLLRLTLDGAAGEVLCFFDEILPDGRWIYRRNSTNDVIYVRAAGGPATVTARDPYTLRHVRILCQSPKTRVTPALIAVCNDRIPALPKTGDARCDLLLDAARRSLSHNAFDIPTDCAGRERAGWLCDSHFFGMAEHFFLGENRIERAHLENVLLGNVPEIAAGMLPMCFPSDHAAGTFIPNWAMWFVLELSAYHARTGDASLVARARPRVYALLDFFAAYRNEDGLLEGLPSWVFVDWGDANRYTSGVSYPSNMLYTEMLTAAGELYGDAALIAEAARLRPLIAAQSYRDGYFRDHAVRVDGALVTQGGTSEACQYYALLAGIPCEGGFAERMRDEFGPLSGLTHAGVAPAEMFIGYYLRFMWLGRIGEYARRREEMLCHFGPMAAATGTLWERNTPIASCDHGFAAVAAAWLMEGWGSCRM